MPDARRTPEQILGALTWPEKLAQLQIVFRWNFDEAKERARQGTGALFWPGDAEKANELQRIAMEESSNGIPLLIGLDVVHGHFTIFPTPLAQAASFDPVVAEVDAQVSASEARANGVNWTFSPMVDTTRDPRWGRVVEGFGEAAFLTSAFGVAKVRGYQSDDLAGKDSLAACLKHFVAYGAAEAGRDYNTTDVSRRRLRETYLEPFRRGIDAGASSVMASFNSLNGTPMHAHRELLSDVLSAEWGFDGVVVGDADGVAQLVPHGVAADERAADILSLEAGLDVIMGGELLSVDGEALISPDDLDPARVDAAVLRVLRMKDQLGLFDDPYVDASTAPTGPTEVSLAAAQASAERCTVLLKNDEALLPVSNARRRVLLTGPYATSTDHLGAWVQHFGAPASTLETALSQRLPDIEWSIGAGADFFEPSADEIEAARAQAIEHDLVIVAVGEPSSLSGEASSRSDIRLPGDQDRLIHAIADTGVPFIVLLATGRPLVVEDWIDRAPSVLLTWHLGTRGPEAIARVLAGDVDPGGRVPMTFPRAVGQIPIHHDHERTGRPATTGGSMTGRSPDVGLEGPDNLGDHFTSKYVDLPLGPRFEFGHGLTYSAFSLSDVSLSTTGLSIADLRRGSGVEVRAVVTNTSRRSGDDVVFLYLTDPVASVAQPLRRLRGFSRVHLRSGDSTAVAFTLAADDLGFWTDGDRFVLEPGDLLLTLTDGTTTHVLSLTLTTDKDGIS